MPTPALAFPAQAVELTPGTAADAEVCIIGAGVVGLMTAFTLRTLGSRVVLVDPRPGAGAATVAGGMLAATVETGFAEATHAALHVAGLAAWHGFAEDLAHATGQPSALLDVSTYLLGVDRGDRLELARQVGFQRSLGLEIDDRPAAALQQAIPGLAPGLGDGWEVPGDLAVDNRAVLADLATALRAAGVAWLPSTVASVRSEGGRFVVELDEGGPLEANQVVVATGAAPLPVLPAEVLLPAVRPVKGTVLRLGPSPEVPPLSAVLRALVRGRPCYLVPRRDGSLAIGATASERGFDVAVDAGAVHQLLDDARQLFPGIDQLPLLDATSGLRPATADHRPVVRQSEIPGLHLGLGLYRNGFLLGPLAAATLAALVTGAPAPATVSWP